MSDMLSDPRFWVAVALVVGVAVGYKKIVGCGLRAVDERAAKIKAELDQARALREEAQALLAQYQQKQAEYLKEAETMLESARRDADLLRAQAEKDLNAQLEARTKQAMDRIAQEESQAVNDVRNHVVDIALATARSMIAEQMAKTSQDDMVKAAIADIERKIH